MFKQFSPNMLKTYELCSKKFDFKYNQSISMPVNDEIFVFGKNIHALASYFLRGENIEKMELALNEKEKSVWEYLKNTKYFTYSVINTEYNLSVKVGEVFFGGRLDALVKNGTQYYILDYKTGSIPKNPKFDFQTIIYTLAVKEFFKTDNISFVYIDLKNRDEVVIKFEPTMEEIYKNKLLDVIEKIKSDDFEKNKKECSCEYNLICY